MTQSKVVRQLEGDELVTKLTAVVREADQAHQVSGGGTRHYVCECLLPLLEKANLRVVELEEPPGS